MQNNLYEVFKFEDIVDLLMSNDKKFIVLSLITDNTHNDIKKMIKKFIKEKSKVYPKVLFLLYKVNNTDFGRLDPIFTENPNQTLFPKLLHIYDSKILIGTLTIDNKEIMDSSFEKLHESYLKGFVEEEPEKPPPKDMTLEKQKYFEKIELLKKIQEKSLNNFYKDCQKRKKEEENIKK